MEFEEGPFTSSNKNPLKSGAPIQTSVIELLSLSKLIGLNPLKSGAPIQTVALNNLLFMLSLYLVFSNLPSVNAFCFTQKSSFDSTLTQTHPLKPL